MSSSDIRVQNNSQIGTKDYTGRVSMSMYGNTYIENSVVESKLDEGEIGGGSTIIKNSTITNVGLSGNDIDVDNSHVKTSYVAPRHSLKVNNSTLEGAVSLLDGKERLAFWVATGGGKEGKVEIKDSELKTTGNIIMGAREDVTNSLANIDISNTKIEAGTDVKIASRYGNIDLNGVQISANDNIEIATDLGTKRTVDYDFDNDTVRVNDMIVSPSNTSGYASNATLTIDNSTINHMP